MKLENVERIEKTIFSVGMNFKIKNVVVTGKKGKDNIKLDPIYSRNYKSSKYSDRATLDSMHIETSDFIVFAYNDFKNKVNEEVYISYPHMLGFLQKIEEVAQMVSTQDMYVNGGVNPNYQSACVKTSPLGGQKSLAFIPAVFENQDRQAVNGVFLFINSNDIYVPIDVNSIMTIYYILKDFNLYTNSSILLQTGLLFDGAGSGVAPTGNSFSGNSGSTPFGGSNNAPFGNKPQAPRANIFENGGGNKGGNNSLPNRPVTPTETIGANDLSKIADDVKGNEVPFGDNDIPPMDINQGGSGPLSLANIQDAAKEIEIPNLEEDGEEIPF